SCPASASDSSPVRSLPTTCAVAMFSVYPCPFGASFIRMGSHISLRNGFTDEQVERARRYHGPLYLTLAVDLLFAVGVLAVLAFTRPGDWLYGAVDELPWWGAAPAFAALVVCVSAFVRLPLGCWRGFVRERRWGLSTQGLGGWVADLLKGTLVGAVFAGL